MTGKDVLTLLLIAYGFKNIKIDTYRGTGNAQGYIIEAYHEERDFYYMEENCEGLLFNITYLINEMKNNKIEPTYTPFPGHEYSVKEMLNLTKQK